jgi:hypothetical protein
MQNYMKFMIITILSGISGAATADIVTFGCDADQASTCYFSIRYASGNGNRNFTMRGGTNDNISSVVPGSDYYLVSIDQSPPVDPSDCGKTYWCKRATISSGYNN